MNQTLSAIEDMLGKINNSIKDAAEAILLSTLLQSTYSSSSDKQQAIDIIKRKLNMPDEDNYLI